MGEINITIFLDREADISLDVTVPSGATVADVKAQLAAADPSGSTKADEIILRLPPALGGSARPLPDGMQLQEQHSELDVVAEDDCPAAADCPDAADSLDAVADTPDLEQDVPDDVPPNSDDSAPDDPAPPDPWQDSSADTAEKVAPTPALTLEEWRVVHDRVVRRAAAEKNAKMLGVEKKGAVIQGVTVEVDGVEWVKSLMKDPASSGEIDSFVMIDGKGVGLDLKLLERIPIAVDGDYWVMQAQLFKKPGSNPETQKVIKLNRPVGSIIKTTGKTWTGPSGGEWIELDPASEKPGWLLVEGPGFNVPGPMLEQATPGQREPLVLKLYSMITSSVVCEICVHKSQTIFRVKQWVGLRDPHGLDPKKVLVANEMPNEEEQSVFSIAQFPTHKLYADKVKLEDTVFKAGDKVPYFYMGESTDDGRFAKKDGS